MIQRCGNKNAERYPDYGGRGIKVHPSWRGFNAFLADMGPSPGKGWSLERKDNNGNYCPRNCIWLPKTLQARNKRTTRYAMVHGRRKSLSEWCEIFGISGKTFRTRIRLGWDEQTSLITPIDEKKRNHQANAHG
jgi:hypothetical protein